VQVQITSIKANWLPFAVGSGTNTAEGYELDASTMSNFNPIAGSSITTDATVSTLTVNSGLLAGTTYYLRVGALNYNNVPNFVFIGSTETAGGAAPTNPIITAVYASSMTVTWGSVGSLTGYVLGAYSDPGYTSLVASSVTADGN